MDTLQVLKISEVAALLRVSPSTIRRLMRDEGLPFVQFGKWGALTFNKDAVLKWHESNQRPAPAGAKVASLRRLRRKA